MSNKQRAIGTVNSTSNSRSDDIHYALQKKFDHISTKTVPHSIDIVLSETEMVDKSLILYADRQKAVVENAES